MVANLTYHIPTPERAELAGRLQGVFDDSANRTPIRPALDGESPKQDRKIGQVEFELGLLGNVIGNTAELVDKLTDRLSSVLQAKLPPAPTTPATGSAPEPSLVPRADSVRMLRYQLIRRNDELAALLERLEL
jgi:hypothetical protein